MLKELSKTCSKLAPIGTDCSLAQNGPLAHAAPIVFLRRERSESGDTNNYGRRALQFGDVVFLEVQRSMAGAGTQSGLLGAPPHPFPTLNYC
jgi:hypothetical protein